MGWGGHMTVKHKKKFESEAGAEHSGLDQFMGLRRGSIGPGSDAALQSPATHRHRTAGGDPEGNCRCFSCGSSFSGGFLIVQWDPGETT